MDGDDATDCQPFVSARTAGCLQVLRDVQLVYASFSILGAALTGAFLFHSRILFRRFAILRMTAPQKLLVFLTLMNVTRAVAETSHPLLWSADATRLEFTSDSRESDMQYGSSRPDPR